MILARIRGIILVIQFAITVLITIATMYLFKNHIHKIIKIWMKMQIKILGIKIEIIGEKDETCDLILINHKSLLDIIIIEHLHNRHIAWVAKKEITNLFLFGHVIKASKMISIDRQNKSGLISLLKDSKNRLDLGRPIAMFPEGTRSYTNKLLSFKAGAKILANKYELKVQPVIILNTQNIINSKTLEVRSGIVKIIYLESLTASKKTKWFEEMESNMNKIYDDEIKKYDT